MLNVSGISGTSSEKQVGYYKNEIERHQARDQSEYLTGYYKTGAVGQWQGQLAEEMGLSGEVDLAQFGLLLEGVTPDGQAMPRIVGKDGRQPRMANDLTFSAPKSISIAAAVLGDNRLVEAHEAAVSAALAYIEKEIMCARYGRGGKISVETGNAIFAKFTHEDARPVGGITDPGIHTHALAMNITKGIYGELRATDLQFGPDNVRWKIADYIYKTVLAELSRELGYKTRATKDGFELDFISGKIIKAFSRRKDQLDEELRKLGKDRATSTGAERSAVNLASREKKGFTGEDEVRREWRERAQELGVKLEPLEPHITDDARQHEHAAKAVTSALNHVSERSSVFSEEQAFMETLKAGMSTTGLDALAAAFCESEEIVKVGDRITTQTTIEREENINRMARDRRGLAPAFLSPIDAATFVADAEAKLGFTFSKGQREALTLSSTSTDGVLGIVGAAGAGKTTAMTALRELAQLEGAQVVGVAPSAKARDELEKANPDEIMTLASFLLTDKSPEGPRLLIMDESGMVSAKDMETLLSKMRANDRLVLVGDPKQLDSVQAGSPFAELMNTGSISFAQINEINRQKDAALLDVVQTFADGRAVEAVAKAQKYMHTVTLPEDDQKPEGEKKRRLTPAERAERARALREEMSNAAADKYLSLSADERSETLVISSTNATRQAANQQIREGLQQSGVLSAESVTISRFKRVDLTEEKARRAENFEAGQIIKAGKNEGRIVGVDSIANTLEIEKESGERQTLDLNRVSQEIQAFDDLQIQIAAGDKLIFTMNNNKNGISNGQETTVLSVDHKRQIATLSGKKGREIEIDLRKPQHLDYGYCVTVHRAQGATFDRAIIIGEVARNATAKAAYVAISRARLAVDIFTNNVEKLSEKWAKYADRKTAREAREAATEKQAQPEKQKERVWERLAKLSPAQDHHQTFKKEEERKRELERQLEQLDEPQRGKNRGLSM